MEQEYLIDTNVIIDYMGERFSTRILDYFDTLFNSFFYLSIINKIELHGFRTLSVSEEKFFNQLVRTASVISLHDGIVEETISTRKKFRIKLPNAIIAASAISTNTILVTGNTLDFSKINGLKTLNPNNLK